MLKTKVTINSVVVKNTDGSPDPKKVISWEYTKSDEEIASAEIIVPRNISDLVDINNGQVVEIESGYTTATDKRYFYGYITSIIPEGGRIKIICHNEMIKLVRLNINKVYDSSIDASAGEVSEIVEDMIETYGGMSATVQSSGTADGERIDQFKCINTDIWERVQALKKSLDWDLYYDDDDRIVYFEPLGFNDSGITLTTSSEIVGLPEWETDDSNMINDLRVDGATTQTTITEDGQIGVTSGYTTASILLTKTPDSVELYMDAADPPTTQLIGGSKDGSTGNDYYVDRENKKVVAKTGTTFSTNDYAIINYVWSAPAPIHMINQISKDTYGSHEKVVQLNDITSIADAESRATNILATRSIPFVSGKIMVRSSAGNIPNRGELVNIVDDINPTINGVSVSGEYVVKKIVYRFPSAIEEIEVGDEDWRLADWQQSTEERLKRLEEQFVRNQDIIVEVVSIDNTNTQNFKKLEPRYRGNLTRDVSTDTLWGVDNWNAKNWDGTYDNAEALNFMMQHKNLYTEEFTDDDFESTNTTASWSTTGSVSFTSGQIAESEPIDYNNGTITTATLTSTEVSGSFTYEMTADGSNWETVTSGSAHTFINSGTDLRWRATENAASTGEISKIIISAYH